MPLTDDPMPPRPPRPLKVGYILPETEHRRGPDAVRWTELRAMAQRAEAVGFDSLWVIDHLLFRSADGESHGGWECWSLMAALAAVTTRVELGQYVTSNLFRNPALLAKIAATVDEISGGRLILGIGAGDGRPDTGIFGIADDHRVGRFEEAIQIVHGLLRTGHVDFRGQYYQARDCELRPRGPRPDGPPILIGAEGPRMLRLTAQYADLWNTALPLRPEALATALAPLDAACAAVGRDPATLGRSLTVPVDIPGLRRHPPSTAYGIDRAEYAARTGALVTGESAAIAERLRAYARAGIGHVVVWLDPDTVEGIEAFAPVLDLLDRG
jgi:alkanesulfonate monooxygenase SsuD/methylene tetrahydromethanopterin reductase-like flavin-dependent oxidoreductase (luciferase family)